MTRRSVRAYALPFAGLAPLLLSVGSSEARTARMTAQDVEYWSRLARGLD